MLQAAMEAEAKRVAEEEKAPHISVRQLEELYQISRAEADLEKNTKLDVKQLLHELRMLIIFNVQDSTQRLSAIAKLDLLIQYRIRLVDCRKYKPFEILLLI